MFESQATKPADPELAEDDDAEEEEVRVLRGRAAAAGAEALLVTVTVCGDGGVLPVRPPPHPATALASVTQRTTRLTFMRSAALSSPGPKSRTKSWSMRPDH